jgi:activator of HSP90 ATPase
MPKTIQQKIVFNDTSCKDVYELYMDSKKHSMATGSPAKISSKEGGSFSAHNNYIKGKNLQIVADRLIVQSWRGEDWNSDDLDSTLIITLEQEEKDVVLHLLHVNVPDNMYDTLTFGWQESYWKPWKKFLKGKPIDRFAGL